MLDPDKLKADLDNATTEAKKQKDVGTAMEIYNRLVADAIYAFVLSGDVNTVGTATSQKGKMT